MSKEIKIHCKYDELVNLKDLKKNPKNPNSHGQDQINRLSEIYKYQGVRHPIIVSKLTGYICAGHGRLLSAIRVGMDSFPVVYQDFNSLEQEYAFLVSDNAIADWSELDMTSINTDIQDLGPDFNIDMLGISNFVLDMSEIEIEENENENENYNFVIKCKSKEETEYIKNIFDTQGTKITFLKFREIYENCNN